MQDIYKVKTRPQAMEENIVKRKELYCNKRQNV